MALHRFMLLILFSLISLTLRCSDLEFRWDWHRVLACEQYSWPYLSSVKIDFKRSGLQMLQSWLYIPRFSFCTLNVRNCIDVFKRLMSLIMLKGWHVLGSREHWWVRAICADSFTKMGEANSCIMLGYLLPLTVHTSIFQRAEHDNTLAAH